MRSDAEWKYYSMKTSQDNVQREGRLAPKEGRIIKAKYHKIEWLKSTNYYIVITEACLIRYLDSKGQELFD
jgi:hypothetical protein